MYAFSEEIVRPLPSTIPLHFCKKYIYIWELYHYTIISGSIPKPKICGLYEIYTTCMPLREATCKEPKSVPTKDCKPGCTCLTGFVRNYNQCILQKDCNRRRKWLHFLFFWIINKRLDHLMIISLNLFISPNLQFIINSKNSNVTNPWIYSYIWKI